MKRLLAATALLAAVLGVFALSDRASATNAVLDDFTATYPATVGTALANCSTCHTSPPVLNAYGSAVKASGFNFTGIQDLDSDGDGFTNIQEIRALTLPGDASDHPTTSSSTTTSTTSTTSATSTTSTTGASPQPAAAATPAAPIATPAGAVAFEAGEAGKVWLEVVGGRLKVSSVNTVDATWQYSLEDDDGDDEIEIEFRSGDTKVEFEAELEDGTIRTKVEVESENDEDDDHDRDDDEDRDDNGDDKEEDDEDDEDEDDD